MSNEPFARFFYQAEKDKQASTEEGRDIFRQVEYVSVTHPGRKDYELVTAATEEHKTRFAKAYEAFKESEKEPEAGTPLKMVPIMSVDAIAQLKAAGIKTLEAFAGLCEDALSVFPPEIADLHKKALTYLEAATDKGALAAKFSKAVQENEALKADLEEARRTIADIKRENETLQKLLDGSARGAGPAKTAKAS